MKPIEMRHFMKVNKIKSKDVAKLTGYSVATISNYLTETREIPKQFIDIFKKVYASKLNEKTPL